MGPGDPKLFLTQVFSHPILFGPNSLFISIFFNPNSFGLIFWTQLFWTQSFLNPKFQETLVDALKNIFPERKLEVNNDNHPWMNHELELLDKKCKRIYRKEGRSERWKYLNKIFKQEEKRNFTKRK